MTDTFAGPVSTEVYNLVRNVQRDYPRLRALVNQAMEFGLEETDVAALQVAAAGAGVNAFLLHLIGDIGTRGVGSSPVI